jgi:hypothetical protein
MDNLSSIGEISNVIRQKEQELHEIHERRCAHLEKVVNQISLMNRSIMHCVGY